MTVYTFTKDVANNGTSACTATDDCIANWPALTVPTGTTPTAGAGATGKIGTITRTDTNGALQVTYNGLPLYFFSGDKAVGDSNGIYTGWSGDQALTQGPRLRLRVEPRVSCRHRGGGRAGSGFSFGSWPGRGGRGIVPGAMSGAATCAGRARAASTPAAKALATAGGTLPIQAAWIWLTRSVSWARRSRSRFECLVIDSSVASRAAPESVLRSTRSMHGFGAPTLPPEGPDARKRGCRAARAPGCRMVYRVRRRPGRPVQSARGRVKNLNVRY